MDILILCVAMMVLINSSVMGYAFLKLIRQDRPEASAEPELTPEELEARRTAARAQQMYDQGFINMMAYNGSPRKKEEREEL